ncbi:MAG: M23 family metallopeptidase [Myxococcales bacterium]|nr:M23 family metallopeptidase [Myxococcales bacterium]
MNLLDVFGLRPVGKALREARIALGGDPYTPRSRFDHTSLKALHPSLSVATWLGHRTRRAPIVNLFNRTQTAIELGWSVRVTQVRDFRGGTLTYDSHNGTDLAVPVGTVVVAAAAGRVVRVSSEFHRGGLKVMIDHGRGLVTTSNHLATTLCGEGQLVARAQPIALSGYSGIDGFLLFPWSVPHIHYNVWLDGVPIDPFAADGETAIWRGRNEPVPASANAPDDELTEDKSDDPAVARAIASCRDPALRDQLAAIGSTRHRFFQTMFALNYYPTRFAVRPPLYADAHPRLPRLDLPLRGADFDGIRFAR